MSPLDAVSAFCEAMRADGFDPPADITPGRIVRFAGLGKAKGKNAWCLMFADCLGGQYGDWSDGESRNWQAKRDGDMDESERRALRTQREAARRARDEQRESEHEAHSREAERIWDGLGDASGVEPYLTRKKVKAHGVRVADGAVIVPMRDASGRLWSLQSIFPTKDANGTDKKFMFGGRINGCFHALADLNGAELIAICEGYATAATVYESTGLATVAAFNAGNLGPVARAIRLEYPNVRLAIFADDDADKSREINPATGNAKGNAGLDKARAAALESAGALVLPTWLGPRPAGATDFNDLAASEGVGAVRRIAIAALGANALNGTPIELRVNSFVSAAQRLKGEREERIAVGTRLLSMGIPYLNHAFGGLAPDDVMLLSASTGAGKSEAAATIALAIAAQGKRAHMFALEATKREIERRIKFRILATMYHGGGSERPPLRYQDWYQGQVDHLVARYESDADAESAKLMSGLFTLYKVGDFTASAFAKHVMAIAKDTDAFILDHLHYLDSEDQNENSGYKKMVQKIRDCALESGKPNVVVAHIRKADRFSKMLVPGIEEIHGSSDISKVATRAVMFARADDEIHEDRYVSNTYVRCLKNRTDGSVCRYIAMIEFDQRTNSYSPQYKVYAAKNGGTEKELLPESKIPFWAKGATHPMGDDPADDPGF